MSLFKKLFGKTEPKEEPKQEAPVDFYERFKDTLTADQMERKKKNDAFIAGKGIKVNKNLPCVESEDEVEIRTLQAVKERTLLLANTNLVAFQAVSGEDALKHLEKYDLLELATPKEVDFLNDPTEAKRHQETWKCECIWVFLWALNVVDDLGFPNQMADLNKVPAHDYPVVSGVPPTEFFERDLSLRSKAEILDANDLYYRLDWACVDARINGSELETVIPGVVYERHYALNWLINYMGQDWDDVSCDT